MSTIIVYPDGQPHSESRLDAADRRRRDRLARATTGDLEAALAFLGVIDPDAFEIAFNAVPRHADDMAGDPAAPEGEEPMSVCRECGAPVGIFLDHGLQWQHFQGDAATAGAQEIYDPGHPAEVGWLLPGEDPTDL